MYIKSFVSKVFILRFHKTTEVTLFHNFSVTDAARIQVADTQQLGVMEIKPLYVL